MARICKTKGCNNEIPDGWKVPYCDACRYRAATKVRNGFKAAGSVVLTVGGTVLVLGKDVIVEGAKTILKR